MATQRVVDVWVALPPFFLLITFLSVLGTGGDGFLGLGRGPNVTTNPKQDDIWIWDTFFRSNMVIFSLGNHICGVRRPDRPRVRAGNQGERLYGGRALN